MKPGAFRFLGLLLACLLLDPAVRSAAQEGSDQDPIEVAQALVSESDKLRKDLADLREKVLRRVGDPKGPGRLEEERQALRNKLSHLARQASDLYPSVTEIANAQIADVLFTMKDKEASKNPGKVRDLFFLKDIEDRIRKCPEKIQNSLREDEDIIAARRNQHEQQLQNTRKAAVQKERRNRMLLFLGVLALCLVGGVFVWTGLRKSEPIVPLEAPPGQAPGNLLGGTYQVQRETGWGSIGPAYEGFDIVLQRKVVIKKIREEILRSLHETEQFLAIARLAALLKNANIAELYAVLPQEKDTYLVCEHMAGQTLEELLKLRTRLTLSQAKQVVRQLCFGLAYSHARKAVHGDIRPANVMVTQEGIVKLLDFGVGRQAQKTLVSLNRTEPSGSRFYMAPEFAAGADPAPESDMYSLGVLCYEMLAGTVPFPGQNLAVEKAEMLYRPASECAPGVPKEVDGFLAKAMQPDPLKRLRTAKEFLLQMESIADPSAARTPPAQPQPARTDGVAPPRPAIPPAPQRPS